ncbi:MAG: hypothetical protein P1U86_19520 [Verrucomicrobiales bacterium]|nr:hypothetical protein [Verrucomicrobiales bacterium]
MRQRFITFAVLSLVLIGIGEWNLRSGKIAPLNTLNDLWLDFCVGNSGDKIQKPSLTVVRINDGYEPLNIGEDKTQSGTPRLSRLDFATILGFAAKMNPKAVSFLPTPAFDEENVLNKTDIVPLKDAAMQLPRFAVATTISDDGDKAIEKQPVQYTSLKVEGDASSVLSFTRTVRYPDPQILSNGIPAFKAIESARGLIGDNEAKIPLLARKGDQIIPSIILTSVASHAGVAPEEITVNFTGKKPAIQLGEYRTVPINADGTMTLPNHSGLKHALMSQQRNEEGKIEEKYHLTSLSVDELAYTGEENDEVAKRILSSFQGKFKSLSENLVVIGFDRTADRHINLPGGEVLSETSLITRAMAVIQSGRFLTWWPTWGRWLAVAAIALIALILFKLPKGKFAPLTIAAGLLYFSVWILIFKTTLSWTPPFVGLTMFGLILLVGLLIPADAKKVEEAPAAES